MKKKISVHLENGECVAEYIAHDEKTERSCRILADKVMRKYKKHFPYIEVVEYE